MTITDPPVTPGEWRRDNRARMRIVGDGDRHIAVCSGHSSNVRPDAVETENEANTRLLAASKKMAEALKLMLQADENRMAADKAWDDNDLEASRNRVSSAVIDGVLAEEKAKDALKEAGFTIQD